MEQFADRGNRGAEPLGVDGQTVLVPLDVIGAGADLGETVEGLLFVADDLLGGVPRLGVGRTGREDGRGDHADWPGVLPVRPGVIGSPHTGVQGAVVEQSVSRGARSGDEHRRAA
jgi:hypothetical protein